MFRFGFVLSNCVVMAGLVGCAVSPDKLNAQGGNEAILDAAYINGHQFSIVKKQTSDEYIMDGSGFFLKDYDQEYQSRFYPAKIIDAFNMENETVMVVEGRLESCKRYMIVGFARSRDVGVGRFIGKCGRLYVFEHDTDSIRASEYGNSLAESFIYKDFNVSELSRKPVTSDNNIIASNLLTPQPVVYTQKDSPKSSALFRNVSPEVQHFKDYIDLHATAIFAVAHPKSTFIGANSNITSFDTSGAGITQKIRWEYKSTQFVSDFIYQLSFDSSGVLNHVDFAFSETPQPSFPAFYFGSVSKEILASTLEAYLKEKGKKAGAFIIKVGNSYLTTNQIIGEFMLLAASR